MFLTVMLDEMRVVYPSTLPSAAKALVAAATSSAEASSFLYWPLLRGKRIKRLLNSWRRATLAVRDSWETFLRRASTEMPIVGASLRGMPASCRCVSSVMLISIYCEYPIFVCKILSFERNSPAEKNR